MHTGQPSDSGILDFDTETGLPKCTEHGILQRPLVQNEQGLIRYNCQYCSFEESEFTVKIDEVSETGLWNIARRQLKRNKQDKADALLEETNIDYNENPDWYVARVTREELEELESTIYPRAKAYARGVPEELEDDDYSFSTGDEYYLLVSDWDDIESIENQIERSFSNIEDSEVSRDYFN